MLCEDYTSHNKCLLKLQRMMFQMLSERYIRHNHYWSKIKKKKALGTV